MPDQVLAGKRQNVGLWLVETNATRALGGEMTLHNDGGAVTSITFEQTPLDGGGR
jgi:two-component sensor histidine kinase